MACRVHDSITINSHGKKNNNSPFHRTEMKVGKFSEFFLEYGQWTYCCNFSISSASWSTVLLQVTGLTRSLVCSTGVCGSLEILATADLEGNSAVNWDHSHPAPWDLVTTWIELSCPEMPNHRVVGPPLSSALMSPPEKHWVPSSLLLFIEGYDESSL